MKNNLVSLEYFVFVYGNIFKQYMLILKIKPFSGGRYKLRSVISISNQTTEWLKLVPENLRGSLDNLISL